MLSRLIFVILFLTSCQRGLIPCPEVEVVRFKEKNAYRQKPVMMAKAKEEPEEKTTTWKKPKDKFVQNVTIEEWDCPKPGNKKYMPKSVRQNIRKNERKIHTTDSLQLTSTDQK